MLKENLIEKVVVCIRTMMDSSILAIGKKEKCKDTANYIGIKNEFDIKDNLKMVNSMAEVHNTMEIQTW